MEIWRTVLIIIGMLAILIALYWILKPFSKNTETKGKSKDKALKKDVESNKTE